MIKKGDLYYSRTTERYLMVDKIKDEVIYFIDMTGSEPGKLPIRPEYVEACMFKVDKSLLDLVRALWK